MLKLHSDRTRQAAFTLLEVMITVAIVGILAMVALPSYKEYIQRSKIIDATSKLGDFRTQQEKYYLDNRTYIGVGGQCGVPDPPVGASDPFAITCVPLTASTYLITATGRAASDMAGFSYTVDQANQRTSSGPGWVSGSNCWAVRKNGNCQ